VDEAAGAICSIMKHVTANDVVIEPREVIRQTQVALITCAKDTNDDDVKANLLLRISDILDNTVSQYVFICLKRLTCVFSGPKIGCQICSSLALCLASLSEYVKQEPRSRST
jgi:hypothetical protein